MNDKTVTEVPKVTDIGDAKSKKECQDILNQAFYQTLPVILGQINWNGIPVDQQDTIITRQVTLSWKIAAASYNNRQVVK